MLTFHIFTLFPDAFSSYLNVSILKRAQERNLIRVKRYDIRRWAKDKHKTVDDKPYGGGAGMVLMAQPILKGVEGVMQTFPPDAAPKIAVLSAKGKEFNQRLARDWARRYTDLILICGRYEGIDERVKRALRAQEISIGRYILTDGDIAAMAVVSAVSRLVPGAIKLASLEEESHWNLLLNEEIQQGKGIEYPHYTRPEKLTYKGKKYKVPKVLLSGNHKKISEWRAKQSARS